MAESIQMLKNRISELNHRINDLEREIEDLQTYCPTKPGTIVEMDKLTLLRENWDYLSIPGLLKMIDMEKSRSLRRELSEEEKIWPGIER